MTPDTTIWYTFSHKNRKKGGGGGYPIPTHAIPNKSNSHNRRMPKKNVGGHPHSDIWKTNNSHFDNMDGTGWNSTIHDYPNL